jgi:sterol desaturase/sphingolipid hydroxylase (fatty acid hydroxylase superfamily)
VNERYIAYAIPVFLLAMVLELLALRSKKIRGYRFADSVANLGSGIGQQMLDPFLRGLTVLGYGFVWAHASVTHLDPKSPLTWGLAILGVDFFYYWFHRASHRVGFLWAVHSVHHQSDESSRPSRSTCSTNSGFIRAPWAASASSRRR